MTLSVCSVKGQWKDLDTVPATIPTVSHSCQKPVMFNIRLDLS